MDQEKKLDQVLSEILSSSVAEIPTAIAQQPGPDNPYLIDLPMANTVDLPIEELASYVARTANAYTRAARYAGMANAEYKLAKGRFDRKYKTMRTGKNDAERDRAAMEACQKEHDEMIAAEAIAELADALEHGARVASESIRKIYGAAQNMVTGQRREETGAYKDQDFAPW